MSVDMSGSLAGALVAVDPAASGSLQAAPAVGPTGPAEASRHGGERVAFDQLIQLFSDGSSFKLDAPAVAPAAAASGVQNPLHSALTSFGPSAPPDFAATTEATWVPSDAAAWFALHAGPGAAGESLPAGGKKLPQALAELGLADASVSAAETVLPGIAPPQLMPGDGRTAATPATASLAGNPQAASAPMLHDGVKAMLAHDRPAQRPTTMAAPRNGVGATLHTPQELDAAPQPASAPGLFAAPKPVVVPEHVPVNQHELAAQELEPRLPTPASTGTAAAVTNSSLPATMAAIEALPLPPLAGPSNLARNQWDQAFGQRVVFLAQNGIDGAQLRLDPPHLGTVHVKISQLDDQTQLLFQAAHPQAREALEAALPKLRDMFAQQGLQLDSAQVTDRDAGYRDADGGDAHGRDPARAGERHQDADTRDVPGAAMEPPPRRGSVRGLVDEFV